MRTLTSLATLAALVSSASLRPVDACGGPPPVPHVFEVSTHVVYERGHGDHRRSFVILDELAPDGVEWRRLAPRTYDTTRIAPAPAAAEPMTLTLIGRGGVRVVSTARRVYLAPAWGAGSNKPRVALEIAPTRDDDFTIAVAGRTTGAAWHALERRGGDAEVNDATTWLASQGLRGQDVRVDAVADSDLEIVSFTPSVYDFSWFVIRRGDASYGAHRRGALAMVELHGTQYIVRDDLQLERV